ncbi:MAG: hypothetical protein E7337_13700 [Clostridiales bacterium]|nr:hypothetical protein [Clostridiales bacterium]
MEQAISHKGINRMDMAHAGRRSGWSDSENKLLWETADEAQQQGLPLKAVFEDIALKTGRRPNSIRNYYYAQVRQRDDGHERAPRFVPFTQQEVDWLMEQVLIARAAGQSVRSCLQKLSGGDHSLMLRYQNKYRAVIKSRPDYVHDIVDRLNRQGVSCDQPQVNHRARADIHASCRALTDEAHRSGDAELARACDTITRYLRGLRTPEPEADFAALSAARELISPIKEFLALPDEEKGPALGMFCEELAAVIGKAEGADCSGCPQ